MPNSCWGPCVTEQLTIARLGHRGDGIADTPAGAGLCALYACRARRSTVEAGRRPSRPPPSRSRRQAEPRARRRRSASISAYAAAARMQHWSLAEYHLWKRNLVAEALAQAGLIAPVADIIDAHGARPPARGVACAARRARRAGSRLHRAARASHRRRSTAARSLRPASTARSPAAWAIAEMLEADGQAARHPGDRDRFRHGRRRARLRPAQFRPHDRARRRRRETPARAHHPARRVGGASARSRS